MTAAAPEGITVILKDFVERTGRYDSLSLCSGSGNAEEKGCCGSKDNVTAAVIVPD